MCSINISCVQVDLTVCEECVPKVPDEVFAVNLWARLYLSVLCLINDAIPYSE